MQVLPKHIKTRALVISIYFISILIIAISSMQFWNYRMLEQAKNKQIIIQEVKYTYEAVWEYIMMSDLGIRALLAVDDEKMLEPHHIALEIYGAAFDELEKLLTNPLIFHDLDVTEEFGAYRASYEVKIQEANHVIMLFQQGKKEEARILLKQDSGDKLYQGHYAPLKDTLYQHLDKHIAQAKLRQSASIMQINIAQFLFLILALPILLTIAFQLRKSRRERKEIYKSLDDSNRQLIFDDGKESNGELEEKAVFDGIMSNLERIAHFIKEITKGRYDIQWEGLSAKLGKNKDNIAGSLVQMRDKMQAVKEKDLLRIWSTEGHALFAEITRRHRDSPTDMYAELISQLVKYLKINQAGLFVLNNDTDTTEDGRFLELAACYAYDRRKYLQRKIYPGDGLVGQVFLEGESTNLKVVPEDYIQITSGLGDANPRALLLAPIKYNNQVVGILELAAFKAFDGYVVKFVEEVGNIVGATLISNHTNAITQKLLKTTQEQAEELRLQEEEMRQNMEELEATQEEMRRQHQELAHENQVLKQQKVALEQALTKKKEA